MIERFEDWDYPEIIDGEPTKYHWIVKGTHNFKLGYKTDIESAISFCGIVSS